MVAKSLISDFAGAPIGRPDGLNMGLPRYGFKNAGIAKALVRLRRQIGRNAWRRRGAEQAWACARDRRGRRRVDAATGNRRVSRAE